MSLYEAYLFDLDGTLVDSAPDLHATLNVILREEGCAPVTKSGARLIGEGPGAYSNGVSKPRVSLRSRRALTGSSSAIWPTMAATFPITPRFTRRPGTLLSLQAAGAGLAVVTNKFEHLAREVLELSSVPSFLWCSAATPCPSESRAPCPYLRPARALPWPRMPR